MKKAIGFLLTTPFVAIGLYSFWYNITNDGWYFVLSMVAMFIILGFFILGCYLLFNGKK